MTIRKQLLLIFSATLLFAVCALFGLVQVTKGARFHQLNMLHLKHVVELRDLILEYPGESPPSDQIRKIVHDIRRQPAECLELIRPWDRLAMRAIRTDLAIALCRDDLDLADEVLAALDQYEQDLIPLEDMRMFFTTAMYRFNDHSARFEEPIGRTVTFTNDVTVMVLSWLAGIVLFVTIALSRRISGIVADREKATKALERSERLNRSLAYYDPLTGLPNRNLFNDRLRRALARAHRRGEKVGLMFIDLDRFKYVNDTLGHEAGDLLITEAARRIESILRKTDTVARFGGDEFVTVIEGPHAVDGVSVAAEKIVDVLKEPFKILGLSSYVTASVGVTVYPDDASDAAALLKNADIAMYEAKARGKNRVEFYREELEVSTQERQQHERSLRTAIERGEFELHFQPIVDLSDLSISGVEALLRWNHSERGLISPSVFIPVAEETGQIVEIGEWVLEQAVEQCLRWRKETDSGFRVAVNVSGVQLGVPGFASRVESILTRFGLPASALDLEITESLTLTEEPLCVKTLHELSEIGVRLLMDDFGTGYSCLAQLHQLPFDVLKIDSSFLRDSQGNPIVATVIGMAQAFGMSVIAEGVETIEVLAFLRERKCQYAQGFLFSRPVTADQIDIHKSYRELGTASH